MSEVSSVPEPAEVEEVEPVEQKSSYPRLSTVGFDARFPNQNQATRRT